MRATHYAKALYAIKRDDRLAADAIVERLVGTLKHNDHLHLLPMVVREFERLLAKEERSRIVRVISAEKLSERDRKAAIAHSGTTLDIREGSEIREEVDRTLTGGWVVQRGSIRVDHSFKRELSELYRTLIATH